MVQPIKFANRNELIRFSEMASKEDFSIYISTPYGQLDAKSILAMFTILGQEVNVVAPDHTNADKFMAFLNNYSQTVR